MRKDVSSANIKRLLVTRTDRIGDLIVSTPFLRALRRKFPDAFIACVTADTNRDLLEGNPDLDRIFLYSKKGAERNWAGNFAFARMLAREKFDAVIHLHPTNRMHIISRLAGIPVRIGWKNKAAWALTHGLEDIKREGKKHESEYNFELLRFFDGDFITDNITTVPLHERSRRSLEELLKHRKVPVNKPWIVLSPGASCPSKRWTPERFGYAASALKAAHEAVFIVIGSDADRGAAKRLKAVAGPDTPLYDLAGSLSLGMLAVLLKNAALLISNDSGPVHIASAFETPVVSIFGRNLPGLSPTRWRPLGKSSRVVWKDVGCTECLAHNCRINFLCLDTVSVREVCEAALSFAPFERLPFAPEKDFAGETR